jgi:hypothetical protein
MGRKRGPFFSFPQVSTKGHNGPWAISFVIAFTGNPAAISALVPGITNEPFAVLLTLGMLFDSGPQSRSSRPSCCRWPSS